MSGPAAPLSTRPLRIVFAGTPDFARIALEQLHKAGHTIALVLTQPDRPAGRGMKLQTSAVKQYAQQHAMPLAQPRSLRLDGPYAQDATQAQLAIHRAQADVMVVAAYGLLLPQWVLDAMQAGKLGCINIHASLLPRWRGAAPIHRAIEAGDAQTGVTIMQMDAGLDTGDMLLVQSLEITAQDTTATLHDKLADLGATLALEALHRAATGSLAPQRQPAHGATYARKIDKAEGLLDWHQAAQIVDRRVRAFNPFPGASSALLDVAGPGLGESLKIWRTQVLATGVYPTSSAAPPGTVVGVGPTGIDVATADGMLRLLQLQRPGGKRLAVADFLQGFSVTPGMRFAAPPG